MNIVDSRIEKKILINNEDLPLALELLSQSIYPFYKTHPDRQVNNLYFDTLDNSCLSKHINGSLIREKYRVRWYGNDPTSIKKAYFEIKRKRGSITDKSKWELTEGNTEAFCSSGGLPQFFSVNDNNAPIKELCLNLEYKLTNSYQRQYYYSPSLNTRLTIDTGLNFFDSRSYHKAFVSSAIIELKVPTNSNDIPWTEIFRALPWRIGRNSKYILGRQLLGR